MAALLCFLALMSGVAANDVLRCASSPDASSCLKRTALALLDTALATDSLKISEDFSVDRRPGVEGRGFSHLHDQQLPASALDGVLMERAYELFSTRTVNVQEGVEEGRRKGYKKKGLGIYLALFGAMGAILLKLTFAALALLSGKALLVGKVALLLSAILGLKSLLAHQPQEKHAAKVVYAEPDVHDWSRSGAVTQDSAQDLVYRGQRNLK